MHIESDKKAEFVKELFENKKLFESYVLAVSSESEREEIMQILSKKLIREDLKEDLNFLYMQDFSHFKFSFIVNLLFKELANEWISFAEEQLAYSKRDALEEIQHKEKVNFVFQIVKNYFDVYKRIFVQEIVETFIELVDLAPGPVLQNELIKSVLFSDLLKRQNVSVIYNYHQLYFRVKDAHNHKNIQISKLQVKISDLSTQIVEAQELIKREELSKKMDKYKKELTHLEKLSLAEFDEALKRVRETMIDSLLKLPALNTYFKE